jgi:hypothetical protein
MSSWDGSSSVRFLYEPTHGTGFVLWYLTRELYYFKEVRGDYLRRQDISSQVAQRTVLLTAIPKDLLTIPKLRHVFGPGVDHIAINRDNSDLQDLVETRDKCAITLEDALTKLIKAVNKIAIKEGRKAVPAGYERNLSSLYIEDGKRPHHRIGLPVIRALFGKKVAAARNFLR